MDWLIALITIQAITIVALIFQLREEDMEAAFDAAMEA